MKCPVNEIVKTIKLVQNEVQIFDIKLMCIHTHTHTHIHYTSPDRIHPLPCVMM